MRKSSEEIQKQTAKMFLANDSREGKRRLELDVCEEEERGSDEPRSSEPTKKKSKILGDVDPGKATITADADASHQSVVTAMDVVGKLGFTDINIATVSGSAGSR